MSSPQPETTAPESKTSEHPTPDAILQLGTAFWASKTLLSAVELGVFTALAERPATVAELAEKLGLHARGARDFLDTLVSLHMLRRDGDRYDNTPETALFLDRAKPSYMGGILEMANARLYGFWGALTTALKTGEPQNEARHHPDYFAEIYRDPARLRGFASAMTAVSMGSAAVIAEKFDWSAVRSFVDVGCAQGAVPFTLARRHPHLTGIGFDLPQIGPIFEEFTTQWRERVRFAGGDFFADPLPTADVVIFGHILHDWDLAGKKKLLRKAYEALPAGGYVIVYDEIIDNDRSQNAFGLLMSLNMLIETPGGFDYTVADGTGWIVEAGFREVSHVPLAGPTSMLVGRK